MNSTNRHIYHHQIMISKVLPKLKNFYIRRCVKAGKEVDQCREHPFHPVTPFYQGRKVLKKLFIN